MELVNFIYQNGMMVDSRKIMIRLIAPIAPFLAEQAWTLLGFEDSVHQADWPSFDSQLIEDDAVTVVCQINGKVRDRLDVPKDSDKVALEELAKNSEKLQKYFEQGTIRKVIYVPNKLLNFVVN